MTVLKTTGHVTVTVLRTNDPDTVDVLKTTGPGPATVIKTTGPATVIKTTGPATVIKTTGPATVIKTTGPVTVTVLKTTVCLTPRDPVSDSEAPWCSILCCCFWRKAQRCCLKAAGLFDKQVGTKQVAGLLSAR